MDVFVRVFAIRKLLMQLESLVMVIQHDHSALVCEALVKKDRIL
jgi:hypothetical protein